MQEKLEYKWWKVPVFNRNVWDYCICKKFHVSVVIVNHQRAECLDSAIWAVLKQETNFEYEIVVIDDASTDWVEHNVLMGKYEQVFHSRKLKYVKICTRLGIYKPWLLGADMADGEILIFQGGEGIQVKKNTMQRLVDELTPDTVAVFPKECWIMKESAEDFKRIAWHSNPEILLDIKPKSKYINEPWMNLGAIRWDDYRRMTVFRKPYLDSNLADNLRKDKRKIKFLDDIVVLHTKHPTPYFGDNRLSHWWRAGKFPP